MSLFSSIGRLLKPVAGAASSLGKVPVLGSALRAVPVVGTALSAASLGSELYHAFGGGGSGAALPSGGLPALPGAGAPAIVGNRSIFRNDANVPDALKPYTISKGDLKTYYRSPLKGYVVLHDEKGDPYAIPKYIAKMMRGPDGKPVWRAAKKPPISVGEMNALRKAKRAIHKVRKVHGLIKYVNDNTGHGGKVVVHHKHKGGHK